MKDARVLTVTTVVAILLVAACSAQPQSGAAVPKLPKAALEDGRAAFEIDLPSDCEMTSAGPKLDFQTFRVSCGGIQYAGLYVGNFADRSVPRSRLLPAPYAWPSEVQVWSLKVPKDQARADRIADSVRVRVGN